jgi:hypothetical protein
MIARRLLYTQLCHTRVAAARPSWLCLHRFVCSPSSQTGALALSKLHVRSPNSLACLASQRGEDVRFAAAGMMQRSGPLYAGAI